MSSANAAGNQVALRPCTSTTAQPAFTWASDHALRDFSLCLDANEAAVNTVVKLQTCNASSAQNFILR